jgi:hypothetical protein
LTPYRSHRVPSSNKTFEWPLREMTYRVPRIDIRQPDRMVMLVVEERKARDPADAHSHGSAPCQAIDSGKHLKIMDHINSIGNNPGVSVEPAFSRSGRRDSSRLSPWCGSRTMNPNPWCKR